MLWGSGLFYQVSHAASGRAVWALAHPEFGSSVNPITTKGADYAHHITASTPGFENPAAYLQLTRTKVSLFRVFSVHDLIQNHQEARQSVDT